MLLFAFVYNLSAQQVVIGTQTWTTLNLDVNTFRNGDAIPEAKTDSAWEALGKEKKPAWCYYNNDPENGKKFGKLYNWFAVNDPRGLAPKGWHIPSDAEWKILTEYLGDSADMKLAKYNWFFNGINTNSSGFSAIPGGNRQQALSKKDIKKLKTTDRGSFNGIGIIGDWWSSTTYPKMSTHAWHHTIPNINNSKERIDYFHKRYGCSVRCVKD